MNLHKIDLVQTSFELVKPQAMQTSGLFYQRIFELNPALKPLFPNDLTALRLKFIDMLTLLIAGLDRPESIIAEAKALGVRHVDYGAKDADYHIIGAALLWAIEQSLGEGFTSEVKDAWHEAYYLIAGLMKEAATAAINDPPPASG